MAKETISKSKQIKTYGSAADVITITGSNNKVYTKGGKDKITLSKGSNNLIDAGTGNDVVTIGKKAGSGNTILAGKGNDTITVSAGAQIIDGGAGSDIITVSGGTQTVNGGAGNDILISGDVNDKLFGGTGADKFIVGAGANEMFAVDGDDYNPLDDNACDTFVFSSSSTGMNTIYEFSAGLGSNNDVIVFDGVTVNSWNSDDGYGCYIFNLSNGGRVRLSGCAGQTIRYRYES